MTRHERRLLTRSLALGVALTALVFAADVWTPLVEPLKRWMYDRRARYCQFFAPPPTDKLVHLDMDDAAMDAIGKWPWPRTVLARLVEELRDAGAKAVAFDVVFADSLRDDRPPPAATQASASAEPAALLDVATTQPEPPAAANAADAGDAPSPDDEEFAAALSRFGRGLIPISFRFPDRREAGPPAAAVDLLTDDLELPFDRLNDLLAGRGAAAVTTDQSIAALRAAVERRVRRVMDRGPTTPAALRAMLLPHLDPNIASSPQLRLVDLEYRRLSAFDVVSRHAPVAPPGLPPLLLADPTLPPIAPLGAAAAATGFVDRVPDDDGIVRSLPLLVRSGERVYPTLGLSLACLQLDVDPASLRLTADALLIPLNGGGGGGGGGGGTIRLPLRRRATLAQGDVAGFADVAWFGQPGVQDQWRTMYDYPRHREPVQHVPVNTVWDAYQLRLRTEKNNRNADRALAPLIEYLGTPDSAVVKAYAAHRPPPGDIETRNAVIDATLAEMQPTIDQLATVKPDEVDASSRVLLGSCRVLRTVRAENKALVESAAAKRQELRRLFEGKSVIFGSISTAAADFVPTSLHSQCPGSVVHGVIFNMVMTGYAWTPAPAAYGYAVTVLLGLVTAVAASWLAPWKATAATLVLVGGWLLINGELIFDRNHVTLDAAAPTLAAGVVWASLTLVRFIVEKAERARITRRFQSYVDPALVNYVVDHPEENVLAGREAELTVVFTDLAGFTTITERLRERAVEVLNEYLRLMTSVIRRHDGYVNKFLGDGIMFFYGAPLPNPRHAAAAVATVLEMQRALVPFNARLRERGLPDVAMRAGVSTGLMIVGDAGGEQMSDYTVLGDLVNLAARLESANKAFGSRTLMTEATAQQLGDKYLLRPIGRLTVKGKTEAIMTYEVLAERDAADDRQRELARLTGAVVDAYIGGDFAKSAAAADALDAFAGATHLTEVYRELSEKYLADPPADFAGAVVLSEK